MGREEILVAKSSSWSFLHDISVQISPGDPEQPACHPDHLSHVSESTLSPKPLIINPDITRNSTTAGGLPPASPKEDSLELRKVRLFLGSKL